MAEPLVTGEPAKHRRLELLDLLRFIAAILVVIFHWFFNGINNGKVESVGFTGFAPIAVYGVYGVHLFFLISGFVISESARGKTAGQFVVSRGVRLFPAYWVAMLVTTFVVTLWGTESMRVTPVQFLANLTMIPQLFGQSAVDGVYWTLTIELTFYLLVFLVLLVGLGRFLDAIFPVWAVLMLVMTFTAPQASGLPYLGGYYALFASGAIMATIKRRGFSVVSAVGLVAAIVSVFMFVARQIPVANATYAFPASPVVVFMLVGAFYCAIAVLWIPRAARIPIPFSRPISDLTYPVYLLHAHIGYTVLSVFGTDESRWFLCPLMFAGLIGAAWVLHWGAEVRLKDFWYRTFGLLRRPVDATQAALSRDRDPQRA